MSPFHVFLRVLLCISLVFYGSGANAAATGMQMAYATAAAATVSSTDPVPGATATASCHDANATGIPAAGQPIAGADDDTSGAQASTSASPDCCEASSSCDCSCTQQVQIATTALIVRGPVPARSTAVRPMTTGHASPALPHLIRPPIG